MIEGGAQCWGMAGRLDDRHASAWGYSRFRWLLDRFNKWISLNIPLRARRSSMSDLALGDNPVALRLQVYTTLKMAVPRCITCPKDHQQNCQRTEQHPRRRSSHTLFSTLPNLLYKYEYGYAPVRTVCCFCCRLLFNADLPKPNTVTPATSQLLALPLRAPLSPSANCQ